jgi:hypothetical protein
MIITLIWYSMVCSPANGGTLEKIEGLRQTTSYYYIESERKTLQEMGVSF